MTVKEKCIAIKNKVTNFWKEHKAEIIIAGVATSGVAMACIAAAKASKEDEYKYDYDCEEQDDTRKFTIVDELDTRTWCDELHRENWDKIQEFCKDLKLGKNESYIIDDSQRYYGEDWYTGRRDGGVLISHLVDGEGCYPPDEEDYTKDGVIKAYKNDEEVA